MNNSNRYANGYVPKIAYWYLKAFNISAEAFLNPSARTQEWDYAWSKYVYFTDRHNEVYGGFTESQDRTLDNLINDGIGLL